APPELARTDTCSSSSLTPVASENSASDCPSVTCTEAGMRSRALEADSDTTAPPAGAASASATLHVPELLGASEALSHFTDLTAVLLVSANVILPESPLYAAVIVAD